MVDDDDDDDGESGSSRLTSRVGFGGRARRGGRTKAGEDSIGLGGRRDVDDGRVDCEELTFFGGM